MNFRITFLSLLLCGVLNAQHGYWQQHVDYIMDIDFDSENHQFKGVQKVIYTNNSPDTMNNIYYHLYFNAFQPGSMMDIRSQNIPDPDQRIKDRIQNLKKDEIGYHKIDSLKQDGIFIKYEVAGTILKVQLNKAILPGQKTELLMAFHSQVPVQIRRSGRTNLEGIDYSMSQWYPKISEYDREGWHANPYISREFYGVWGNFEVNIAIDSSYTIAGTGLLTNAQEIGKGYGVKTTKTVSNRLIWKFKAEKVHDFVWAADPQYIHTTTQVDDGPTLHFFYQNDTNIISNWEVLPSYAVKVFELMNEMVGEYPYSDYSIIQGGDGGMEYPMATLIMGGGKRSGLISVMTHESIHSWFQGVLANDEGSYAWLDEGYDTYYSHLVKDAIHDRVKKYPHKNSYQSYFHYLNSDNFDPISLHADHFNTNRSYGIAAYSMGCVLLNQLNYIIGTEAFDRTMKRYYNTWKFKHPTPTDFKRIAEKESNMELDWYFNYFINTGKKVDYSIDEIKKSKKSSTINLSRIGEFPMPIDVVVTLKDGRQYFYTIPLSMMLEGKKKDLDVEFNIQTSWPWTHPTYALNVPFSKKEIAEVKIDPSKRLADINGTNNVLPREINLD